MTVRHHRSDSSAGRQARGRRGADVETFAAFGSADAELDTACCSAWFVSRRAEHEVLCAARRSHLTAA
ncbi:hypothetical protein [Streptomyces sp. NPDC006552]|uniref:hypothetical protein n=1 Tax=Streptomyces sp. NPDC006552 TaxID=3157179 RepID=UPI0033A8863F